MSKQALINRFVHEEVRRNPELEDTLHTDEKGDYVMRELPYGVNKIIARRLRRRTIKQFASVLSTIGLLGVGAWYYLSNIGINEGELRTGYLPVMKTSAPLSPTSTPTPEAKQHKEIVFSTYELEHRRLLETPDGRVCSLSPVSWDDLPGPFGVADGVVQAVSGGGHLSISGDVLATQEISHSNIGPEGQSIVIVTDKGTEFETGLKLLQSGDITGTNIINLNVPCPGDNEEGCVMKVAFAGTSPEIRYGTGSETLDGRYAVGVTINKDSPSYKLVLYSTWVGYADDPRAYREKSLVDLLTSEQLTPVSDKILSNNDVLKWALLPEIFPTTE